jgi:kynurenine formamidase
MKLLDLSHPFDADGPVNKKKDELVVRTLKTVAANGVNTREIVFNNHIGTHVDAPLHLIAGGASVDQLPLDVFYGTAVVLDIPCGRNGAVGRAELERAEPRVRRGDIVAICTGWGGKIGNDDYASHHPYLAEDGAEWLVAEGAKMVGMDVQSVDLPHSLRTTGFAYTSLRILLRSGVPALHNLTNLEAIRGRRVALFALPINFVGADGAPARVVAEVD